MNTIILNIYYDVLLSLKKLRRFLKPFNLVVESDLLSKKIFLAKIPPNIGQKNIVIDSVLKTNPWTCKVKYSNGETITRSFHEKV